MKKLLAIIALLAIPGLALANAYDIHWNLRDATDTFDYAYDHTPPNDGLWHPYFFNPSNLPEFVGLGTNLSINGSSALEISGLAISQTTGLQTALNGKVSTAQLNSAVANILSSASATSTSLQNQINAIVPGSVVQKTRVQTDAAGAYTWTFPNAYGSGVTPVISAEVENATSNSIATANIVSISNTSVTVQVQKTNQLTLLGLTLLGLSGSPQSFIHLMATAP